MDWNEIPAYQSIVQVLAAEGITSEKLASRLFSLMYCGELECLTWEVSRSEPKIRAWLEKCCCAKSMQQVDGYYIGLNWGH